MTETPQISLAETLAAIEQIEKKLVLNASGILTADRGMTVVDMFLLGAVKRTLSQSLAFRKLVEGWNFTAAAVMVRTQLDTAMRINGIKFMQDSEHDIREIFDARTTYRKLRSVGGEKMTDAYLKAKLTEEHEWAGPLYEELSDFVHLSFRHFWHVIAGTSEDQTAHFVIHGEDPIKDESNYIGVAVGFLRVSRLTAMLLVSFLMVRHGVPPANYAKMWE